MRNHRNFLLISALLQTLLPWCCAGFAFQLPKIQIQLPWEAPSSSSSTVPSKKSPVRSNDKIVIFGATGGVGQLVTKKLSARDGKNYQLSIAARDVARAKETLQSNANDDDSSRNIDFVELNLVGDDKATETEIQMAMEGATGIVVSVGTTAFPTKRWDGGNNPKAIDMDAVTRIANAARNVDTVRRLVLLTSVGVNRTKEMPFLILNLFGVLDAKRAGEDAVKSAAGEAGFSYSIVRPGRLIGGPYTNLDLAKLFQIEGGAENGVDVVKGDALLGDCKRDACAEAVVQCLENESCVDLEFSLVSNEEKALTDDGWTFAFTSMSGL
jgi:uncharacterized protein YbjT (DUF2867 family)